MFRGSPIVVCMALGLVLSNSALASWPWKPQIWVPATEGVGIRRPITKKPDPYVLKRFLEAYNRGRQLLSQGKYQEAQKSLSLATQLYPDHLEACLLHVRTLLTLGYLQWNPRMIREARNKLQPFLKSNPQDQNIRLLADLTDELLRRMDSIARHQKPKSAP